MSIKLRTIQQVAILVVLLKPPIMVVAPTLNSLIGYMQVVVVFYLLVLDLRKGMGLYAGIFTVVFSLFTLCTLCTLGNHESITDCMHYVLPCYGIILYFDRYSGDRDYSLLYTLESMLTLYIAIDLISIILFPHGLIKMTAIDDATTVPCWFLGQKNVQIRYVLPYMYVVLFTKWHKDAVLYELTTLVRLAMAMACVVLTASLNGLTGLAVATLTFLALYNESGTVRAILRPLPMFIVILLLTFIIVTRYDLFANTLALSGFKDIHTASARIYVWNAAIALIRDNWLFGLGGTKFTSTLGWWVSHPHNFIMYLWFRGGLLCVVLVLYIIYDALRLSCHNLELVDAKLLLSYILALMVLGIAESLTEFPLVFMPLVVGSHALSRKVRHDRTLRPRGRMWSYRSSSRQARDRRYSSAPLKRFEMTTHV